jgi:hypothetical protein
MAPTKAERTMNNQHSMLDGAELDLVSGGITYPNRGNLADADIQAMCFIVMMQAAKSAQSDLKAVMDGISHPSRHSKTR